MAEARMTRGHRDKLEADFEKYKEMLEEQGEAALKKHLYPLGSEGIPGLEKAFAGFIAELQKDEVDYKAFEAASDGLAHELAVAPGPMSTTPYGGFKPDNTKPTIEVHTDNEPHPTLLSQQTVQANRQGSLASVGGDILSLTMQGEEKILPEAHDFTTQLKQFSDTGKTQLAQQVMEQGLQAMMDGRPEAFERYISGVKDAELQKQAGQLVRDVQAMSAQYRRNQDNGALSQSTAKVREADTSYGEHQRHTAATREHHKPERAAADVEGRIRQFTKRMGDFLTSEQMEKLNGLLVEMVENAPDGQGHYAMQLASRLATNMRGEMHTWEKPGTAEGIILDAGMPNSAGKKATVDVFATPEGQEVKTQLLETVSELVEAGKSKTPEGKVQAQGGLHTAQQVEEFVRTKHQDGKKDFAGMIPQAVLAELAETGVLHYTDRRGKEQMIDFTEPLANDKMRKEVQELKTALQSHAITEDHPHGQERAQHDYKAPKPIPYQKPGANVER